MELTPKNSENSKHSTLNQDNLFNSGFSTNYFQSQNQSMEYESQYRPTKVIFVRSLPRDTSEPDLQHYFSKFGTVSKTLLLISKNHAFIEFGSEYSAISCVSSSASQNCLYFRGRRIFVSFSGREHIVDDRVEE